METKGLMQIPARRGKEEVEKVKEVEPPQIDDDVNWFDLLKLWIRENLINDVVNSKNGVIMESKAWYASKTLWVNLITLAWTFVGPMVGIPTLDPATLAIVLGVVNIVLRAVTKQPVSFS